MSCIICVRRLANNGTAKCYYNKRNLNVGVSFQRIISRLRTVYFNEIRPYTFLQHDCSLTRVILGLYLITGKNMEPSFHKISYITSRYSSHFYYLSLSAYIFGKLINDTMAQRTNINVQNDRCRTRLPIAGN